MLIGSYLKDSSYDENVFTCERKFQPSGVQRVPQLPHSPSPCRPTEDPPSPGTLMVQKRQHVLVRENIVKPKKMIYTFLPFGFSFFLKGKNK